MGTNALTSRVDGNKIPANDHNELVQAFLIDIVPRNNSRVAQDIIGSLGTSALRWLRTYSKEYFMGNAANNLRIYEGAANEIWIERSSSSNELIKLKNGSVEILVGGAVKATINSTGIINSSFADNSIARIKVAEKVFNQKFSASGGSGGLGAIAGMSCAVSVIAGRKYSCTIDCEALSGSVTTSTLRWYFTGAGAAVGAHRSFVISDPANTGAFGQYFEYVYTALASGTLTFVPYGENVSWVGMFTSIREF